MSPFSALYYIRNNKPRCILLMVMLMLSAVIYVGGLYVTSPLSTYDLFLESGDKFIYMVDRSIISNSESHFDEFLQAIDEDNNLKYLPHSSSGGYFDWYTVMGFSVGSNDLAFGSVDDFKIYCDKLNIKVDFEKLRPGSIVLTRMLADNLGLKPGDKLDENTKHEAFEIYEGQSYTVDFITDKKGYGAYMINDSQSDYAIKLYSDTLSSEALRSKAVALSQKYNVVIGGTPKESLESDFAAFNFIYGFIVILVSVILAITINTAFAGMYQKRNYELSVYRAIGISKKKILRKIINELLLIDAIALFMGCVITILFIYLFNNIVLLPDGKFLEYFHPLAVIGVLICNLLSLFPLVLFRVRQIKKADICEY